LEIPAYNDWAGAFMFLATGVGADYHNKNVHNFWMTGVLKYADGSLGGNVRFTTANYGEENTFEVIAELAQTLIPRRVVIGYGFRLKDSKFKTFWLYTAPYNAAARRVVINEVDDVVIYVPYSKHGDRPTDNPQMIVRTFDYCDQHQQLVRAFVTGIGMTTNSSTVTRLGIQITTVN
jgi:hypothetical protein